MVLSSLIRKAVVESYIDVWSSGIETRDFINARDVAIGMIQTMKREPTVPINLCNGKQTEIREAAEIIGKICKKEVKYLNNPVMNKSKVIPFNGNLGILR